MTKEKIATKTKGYFLYSPFGEEKCGRYFFRTYNKDGSFIDYDIRAEEVEVQITSEWISLYKSDNNLNYLDWSSKTLGRPNKNS
jgi:hypothetical protein